MCVVQFRYASIDPHLLLQIFLPALIFESAFSASYHIIKREIGQALLLAGPGVIISMILTAIVGRYCLNTGWNWTTALLFGSILAATDPVAVVALLRELGVSKRLATLIEGESLFNDGTAYVMFLVWIEFLEGNELSPGEIVVYMIRLALGGFLFGIACSIPALLWLSAVFNDPAIETTITFGVAYLCFWLAESSQAKIHVSGVLAIVALGISMNRFKHFISVHAEETVHHFWEMIGFVANTLIFFISGIVVAQRMFGTSEYIHAHDFGYLILLYILIHFIRAITILLLSPFMARMGYGFNWRTGTVLCYGGLRGAVGLALALIVDLNEDIEEEISDLILFHVCGIVLLTLLINGSTTGYVLGLVGLRQVKPSKLRAYLKSIDSIKKQSEKMSIKMRKERMFQMADWALVRKYLPEYEHKTRDLALAKVKEIPFHLSDREIAAMFDQRRESKKSKTEIKEGNIPRKVSAIVDADELKTELIHRLLTAMSAHFDEAYEEGQVARAAIPILHEAVETALDSESLEVLWSTIDSYFCVSTPMVWLTGMWPWLAQQIYLSHFELAVDLAVSFIHALRVIDKVEIFHEFANNEIYNKLVEEVNHYKELAYARWDSVEMDFPNLYYSMQTVFAIRRLLETERRAIAKLVRKGIIDENEKAKLLEALEHQSHFLMSHSLQQTDHRVTAAEVISQIEFWKLLPQDLQTRLRNSKRIALSRGQQLVTNHRNCRVYYVMQGILKLQSYEGDSTHTLGMGGLYGIWASLNHEQKYLSEATSESDPVIVLEIDKSLLIAFMQIPEVHKMMWAYAAADVLVLRHPQVFQASWRKVYKICEEAILRETKTESTFGVKHLTLLLQGVAVKEGKKGKTEAKKRLTKAHSALIANRKNSSFDRSRRRSSEVPKLTSRTFRLPGAARSKRMAAKTEIKSPDNRLKPSCSKSTLLKKNPESLSAIQPIDRNQAEAMKAAIAEDGKDIFHAPDLLTLGKREKGAVYCMSSNTVCMIFKHVAPAIYRSQKELDKASIPFETPSLLRTTTSPERVKIDRGRSSTFEDKKRTSLLKRSQFQPVSKRTRHLSHSEIRMDDSGAASPISNHKHAMSGDSIERQPASDVKETLIDLPPADRNNKSGGKDGVQFKIPDSDDKNLKKK